MSASAIDVLRAGRPSEALALLQDQVRKTPANTEQRIFLFQLLAVLGQWDRALTQLKVLEEMNDSTLAMVAAYREAIASERVRADVFAGRATPLILGQPEPWMALQIEALRLGAAGELGKAAAVRADALDAAPATPGRLNGAPFAWIADADSRLGPMLEVMMAGSYYWVPFHRLRSIKFEPPSDLRDLVWAPAELVFANGGGTVAMIPARYPGSHEPAVDDALKMGRRTEWREQDGPTYVGLGQRMFATDESEASLLEVRTIELDAGGPAASADS